jgi:hypothetical protein
MVGAGIQTGKLFRKVNSAGKPWGEGVTEKLVWHVVKEFAKLTRGSHRTTCVGHALAYVGRPEAYWSRFSFFWGMSLSKRQNATSVVSCELLPPLTTRLASGRHPEIVRALEGWPTIHSAPQTHFPESRLDRARHEPEATLGASGSIPTVHTRLANVRNPSPWRANRARPSGSERRLACSYPRVQ